MKNLKKLFAIAAAVAVCAACMAGCAENGNNVSDSANNAKETKTESSSKKTSSKKFSVPEFELPDIDGNTISSDIFKDKKITMLHIWGTFCTPCIGELPDVGQWVKELPEDAQFIGYVIDIEGEDDKVHIDDAHEIMAQAGADFTNLINDGDLDSLSAKITGVPTTLYIDSEGNVVDEIVGADIDGYKKKLEKYLNE